MSGRRALALRSFKEEAVLARVVRSPPTLSSQSIIKQTDARIWDYPMPALMAADRVLRNERAGGGVPRLTRQVRGRRCNFSG